MLSSTQTRLYLFDAMRWKAGVTDYVVGVVCAFLIAWRCHSVRASKHMSVVVLTGLFHTDKSFTQAHLEKLLATDRAVRSELAV